MLPKFECAQESPRDLVESQILIQEVWGGAQDSAFPTSSQVMLVMLLPRPATLDQHHQHDLRNKVKEQN